MMDASSKFPRTLKWFRRAIFFPSLIFPLSVLFSPLACHRVWRPMMTHFPAFGVRCNREPIWRLPPQGEPGHPLRTAGARRKGPSVCNSVSHHAAGGAIRLPRRKHGATLRSIYCCAGRRLHRLLDILVEFAPPHEFFAKEPYRYLAANRPFTPQVPLGRDGAGA